MKYALCDADGHFGDYTRVYSAHDTLAAARREAHQSHQWKHVQIVGGELDTGDRIHRATIGNIYSRYSLT